VGGVVGHQTGPAGVGGPHLGKQGASHLPWGQRGAGGVERQLRFAQALAGPVAGVDAWAAFVVDHQQPAVVELVDAVDLQLELQAAQLHELVLLDAHHRKATDTGALQLEPALQQPLQAALLQRAPACRQRRLVGFG